MGWLSNLLEILGNRNFAFGVAFALGLILGEAAAARAEPLTLPALGVLIAVVGSEVSGRTFRRWRRVAEATGLAVASTYVVGSAAILLLAWLLVPNPELFTGFVLVAASPPAVGGLGFCMLLRGDVTLSLLGTIGAHVAALAITPLIALALVGPGLIQPAQLFTLLLQLVALPLLVSRLLRNRRIRPYIRRWQGPIISWAYAVVIFAVVGVNRDIFFQQPGLVALIAAVAVGATFGVGAVSEAFLSRLQVRRRTRISLVLFATLKNSGFAAAAALALVSPRASLPGAVASVVNSFFLIWLGLRTGPQAC